MKKQLIIATMAALALTLTAYGKTENAANNAPTTSTISAWSAAEADDAVNQDDIKPEIKLFVENHFPKAGIAKCLKTEKGYKVKLDDGTFITFSPDFTWTKVKCEKSTRYKTIPTSVLPEQLVSFMADNHADKAIIEVEKTTYGWEIELDNNDEIRLNEQFQVIPEGKSYADNAEIKAFVATYFPLAEVRKAQLIDDEIEVKLTDKTEIGFTTKLEWKSVDCEDATIYTSVPAKLIPDPIAAFMRLNYPNNNLEEIEKEPDGGWEIEIDNQVEFKFDSRCRVTGYETQNK